jgi:hypothetical protein
MHSGHLPLPADETAIIPDGQYQVGVHFAFLRISFKDHSNLIIVLCRYMVCDGLCYYYLLHYR